MSGETYTQREDLFFPYLLPRASGCQLLHPLASSSETPLIGCVSLARLRFSALCLNLTTWFSSRGLLPVTHLLYPSALIVLSCLLITTWQLIKVHGVTRNEPKIHGICYITLNNEKSKKLCVSRVKENIIDLFFITFLFNSIKFFFMSFFYILLKRFPSFRLSLKPSYTNSFLFLTAPPSTSHFS